jgi:hypothetical protein
MSGREQSAAVTLLFIESNEGEANVTVQATSLTWRVHDMGIAHTLREQLNGLLGKASNETIWPALAADAMGHLKDPWPGMVRFSEDDDAAD